MTNNSISKSSNVYTRGKRLSNKRSRSSKKSSLKVLSKTTIKDEDELKKYLPRKIELIKPKVWELTNRKTFHNWLRRNFSSLDSSEYVGKENEKYKRIQKLVSNFIQDNSPYRGLLLYHGLGTGKTCGAIAISESLRTFKKVVIISSAALEKNFIDNIMKCGQDYMSHVGNHWTFIKGENNYERELIRKIGVPRSIIDENDGCFIIDYSKSGLGSGSSGKSGNFNSLSNIQKKKLEKQINATIKNRFEFIHFDDTRIANKLKDDAFDDKVVIVDEVHNLINRMRSGTPSGEIYYKLFMNAKNSKLIFLSATPFINNPFEAAKLYNVLRGPIKTLEFRLVPEFGKNIQWGKIRLDIISDKNVDQIIIDKIKKLVKITKNPDNFINSPNGQGIIYKPDFAINDFSEFKKHISGILNKGASIYGFSKALLSVEDNLCLPNDSKSFTNMFYNINQNKIKNRDVLQKRIMGLTSYYETVDKVNYPSLKNVSIVQVPMSDYQLIKYQKFRLAEIDKEKKQKKMANKEGSDEIKGSYRIYSRLHCTFAFPEEVGSPYDQETLEAYEMVEESDDIDTLKELESEIIEKSKGKVSGKGSKLTPSKRKEILKEKKKFIDDVSKNIMSKLYENKEKLMSIHNGSLKNFGPKYYHIIKSINKNKGCCFVYSQFFTRVGLKTFAIGLDADGYEEFKLVKIGDEYHLPKDYNPDTKKYIFYAGDTKDKNMREILRLIYNSELDRLPQSCSKLKKDLMRIYGDDENLHGNIIKVFLTTRSGAEGVDLKHIREIHIIEPYWQPVLIKQIIGRGVRYKSHLRLPPSERNVSVFIYMAVFTDSQIKDTVMSTGLRADIAKQGVQTYNKVGKLITSDENLYITAERKREIIDDLQKISKESSFDCSLNYSENMEVEENARDKIVCLSYDKRNRNDETSYLSAPALEDTIDITNIYQDAVVAINYEKIELPRGSGKFFWRLAVPQPGQRQFLYPADKNPTAPENMHKKIRPVGEIVNRDGRMKVVFFKRKSRKSVSKKSKKSSGKKSSGKKSSGKK